MMKLVRFPELKSKKGIPYSRDQIRRKENDGTFPMHLDLGEGGAIAWIEDEVDNYLAERIEARDRKLAERRAVLDHPGIELSPGQESAPAQDVQTGKQQSMRRLRIPCD